MRRGLLVLALLVLPAGCGSSKPKAPAVDPRYKELATRLMAQYGVGSATCTNIHAPKATCSVTLGDGAKYTCQEDITGFPTDVNGYCAPKK